MCEAKTGKIGIEVGKQLMEITLNEQQKNDTMGNQIKAYIWSHRQHDRIQITKRKATIGDREETRNDT